MNDLFADLGVIDMTEELIAKCDNLSSAAHQQELEHRQREEEQTRDQPELLAEERRRLLTAKDIRSERRQDFAAYELSKMAGRKVLFEFESGKRLVGTVVGFHGKHCLVKEEAIPGVWAVKNYDRFYIYPAGLKEKERNDQ